MSEDKTVEISNTNEPTTETGNDGTENPLIEIENVEATNAQPNGPETAKEPAVSTTNFENAKRLKIKVHPDASLQQLIYLINSMSLDINADAPEVSILKDWGWV